MTDMALQGATRCLSAAIALVLLACACGGSGPGPTQPGGAPNEVVFTPRGSLNEVTAVVVIDDSEVWTGGAGVITRWNLETGEEKRFGAADGLPLTAWTVGTTGPDGSVWFASRGRVVRWDGAGTWQVWDTGEWPPVTGSETLPYFTSATPHGNDVWFGTRDHGIIAFVGGQWMVKPVIAGFSPVNDLVVDADGAVWAAGRGAIAQVMDDDWAVEPTESAMPYHMTNVVEIAGRVIGAISEDGRVFLRESGVLIQSGADVCRTAWGGGATDVDGGWVGTSECGLLQLGDGGHSISGVEGVPGGISVRSLSWEEPTLHIGTAADGLFVLRPDGVQQFSNPEETLGNAVSDLFVDETGRVWAGTDGGAVIFHGDLRSEAVVDGFVTGISQGGDGTVWLVTSDGGVWSVDPTSLETTGHGEAPVRPALDIAVDNQGRVWVGGNGVAWWDDGWARSETSLTVESLFEANGEIWLIGGFGFGIASGTPPTVRTADSYWEDHHASTTTVDGLLVVVTGSSEVHFLADPLAPASEVLEIPVDDAMAATSDVWGRLWISTLDDGLWCLDADGRELRAIPGSRQLLGISALAHDGKDTLWVGGRFGVASMDAPGGGVCPSGVGQPRENPSQ